MAVSTLLPRHAISATAAWVLGDKRRSLESSRSTTLSSAAEFNLGRYPQGKSKSRTFTRAGLVKVYCQIHSHMSATIMVLDHPYFTTPDLDGSFTLPQVPEGRYTIVGWHERVGEQTSTIQIEAGRTASVELSLPLGDAP